MLKYRYETYNPGQYKAEVQEQLDAMSADGWHVHTALPAYTELYILWERDDPAPAQVQYLSAPRPAGGTVQIQATRTFNESAVDPEQLGSPEG